MTTYPSINNERPRIYDLKTRLLYDNEQPRAVFAKTEWSISVTNLPEIVGVLGSTILAPNGVVTQPPQKLTVPEALRVLADDIEFAIGELDDPSY